MKILIASDAWHPQTNGVVRTYEYLRDELAAMGHTVKIIGPRDFPWRIPMPGYREIELALFPRQRMAVLIDAFAPDTIHIGTEGPLGSAARAYCLHKNLPFTTCYHTHFPDYAAKRAGKIHRTLATPVKTFFINHLRAFHQPSSAIMVATPSLKATLQDWGFTAPLHFMTRGARIDMFTAEKKELFADIKRPVAIYVGRIAIEKNLESFLSMDWPGSKVLVVECLDLDTLRKKYPGALFTGKKTGEALAACYQSADVFVFPSRTDTFGMVIVEALACGLPVAAYPVTGPVDIITEPMLGALNENLTIAAQQALQAPGTMQERHDYVARTYTWPLAARQFMEIIENSDAVIRL